MLFLYKMLTSLSGPLLTALLKRRLRRGKEDPYRLYERQGQPSLPRPDTHLIWIHAASVGEAQSALILIDNLSKESPSSKFLITSGTVTSAKLMAKRLPDHAIHQYIPLDHPKWVENFIHHWKPDLALWMESELWPNMLLAIQTQKTPTILVNARLSDKSYKGWSYLKGTVKKLLSTFDLIMAQTPSDQKRYESLGAQKVIVTDNLKHSAAPLPFDQNDLEALQKNISDRPTWLYASTHDGEETLACRVHQTLKEKHPNLLSIIVPRHPERRDDIKKDCDLMGMKTILRGDNKTCPSNDTDIYIADTLGELGLFYRLCNLALIGRSFSNDGGGGHNPIEAAQLDCAVLTGPNVQYQEQLFDEMIAANAAQKIKDEQHLSEALDMLLSHPEKQQKYINAAKDYASSKDNIIHLVLENIRPFLKPKKVAG